MKDNFLKIICYLQSYWKTQEHRQNMLHLLGYWRILMDTGQQLLDLDSGNPLDTGNMMFVLKKDFFYCINQYLSDRNPYSLRNVVSEKLQIPKAKTELFKKTFTYSGPKLWNELPFSIRQASSHNAFKTKVKSLILNDDVP